jgi:hypothetical protein
MPPVDLLPALSWPLALYICLIVLIAYTVRGVIGFASALIAVPLLSLKLPLVLVVPVVSLLDYGASVTHGLQGRRLVRWRDLWPLAPFTVAGVVAGLQLLTGLRQTVLALLLGLFISGYGIFSLLPLPAWRGSRKWAAPAGLLGGLVGTIFGTGGPFYVAYLRLRQLEKSEFRATVAAIFMADGALRLLGFLAAGFYRGETLRLLLAGMPLAAAGLFIGHRLHLAISQQGFGRLVGIVLLTSGLALMVNQLLEM